MSQQGGPVTVYEELERVQAKCARQRDEIRAMHEAFDKGEMVVLRRERDVYRKALSDIRFHIELGREIDCKALLGTVRIALETWNVTRTQRRIMARHIAREVKGGQ